ncbi:adenylate/guanylate cyclase domain-containing protein [Thermodesulfobacteriota bacterium]
MDQEGFKRKLTAILSADVEGYSRLMGEDEDATIRTLTTYRDLMSTLIQKHRGRVVDSPGDNLLAEFGSVVDGVRCAVEVQEELRVRNAELPENRKMKFRIGINLGDVVEEGERIYGDGVNIAARVEGLAEGGGICISGPVYDSIKNKLSFSYESLGEHTVKNITGPIRVFRMRVGPEVATRKGAGPKRRRWAVLAGIVALILVISVVAILYFYLRRPSVEPASLEKMAYPLPEKPSIAVLPLTNMSSDKDQEYFADGITEDIITALSKVSGLFVIARNSTFVYKGKAVKVREVAEDLGIRYILEGSVRRSEDRIRITVQLIDAVKGSHLWAERYDRTRQDLFAVEDDVTQRVVSELAVTLKASEQERLFRRHTENLEAYETFLQARRVLDATMMDTLKAKKLFERVMELDPDFAGGYAGLSLVSSRSVRHGFSSSPKEDMERSLKLAQRAVATDDTFGWSYLALGSAYLNKGEHDKAIAAMEEWIRIQPGSADAYLFLGFNLHWAGRGEEAIDSVKKSMRLNPGETGPSAFILGMSYFTAGRYEDAIAAISPKYATLARKGHLILCFLAASYAAIGQDEKAQEVMKVFLEKHPSFTLSSYPHLRIYKRMEDRDRYANFLRRAAMPEE